MEKSDELISLQNQVKVSRFQDKLGKQNIHEDMKNVFVPTTQLNKDVSEDEQGLWWKPLKITTKH